MSEAKGLFAEKVRQDEIAATEALRAAEVDAAADPSMEHTTTTTVPGYAGEVGVRYHPPPHAAPVGADPGRLQ